MTSDVLLFLAAALALGALLLIHAAVRWEHERQAQRRALVVQLLRDERRMRQARRERLWERRSQWKWN